MKLFGKKRWFTLIEMLIVIVIIWVLASALIPRIGSARGKANDVARKADLQQLATALISYQIDRNQFPQSTAQVSTTGAMGGYLKAWGMASIPVGDTTLYTWSDGNQHTGYNYIPLIKNGWANNGFILMARAETEGWANYVKCSSSDPTNITTTTDVDTITLCSDITYTAWGTCKSSATSTSCIASDKSQLLYIYKY